jgi:Cu(I)/Ag(I) efflux system membrane fusion protein
MKVKTLLLLAAGLMIGAGGMWFAAGHTSPPPSSAETSATAQKWTCSMHPQIEMDHPDVCPLCGMDLEPVQEHAGGEDSPTQLMLSEHARSMARVATAEIKREHLFKELRTVGRVELDETRVANIAAWIDGRVDEVFADFPGTPVRKGEHLVAIFSPQLLSAQEEFLAAYRSEQSQQRPAGGLSLSNNSRRRLQLWGITDAQIDEIVRFGKSQTHMTIYAPIGGTVIEKNVRDGQYVKQGDLLYTIADLSQVWLIVEVYESELSWVRAGQPVAVTLESDPNQPLSGAVAFIEPLLNKATRTVQVRVVLENSGERLKPGMYAEALLRTPILENGQPAPGGLEGKYACPMHPYVVSDKPGDCKVCRMPLEKNPGTPIDLAGAPGVMAVPVEAVLTTGRRQLVYVEREPGSYQLVEPKLGPRAGDFYPLLDGLAEGDRVVVRGNFLLDSQFQISRRPSLLYPQGASGDVAHAAHTAQPKPKPAPEEQENLAKLPPDDRKLAEAQKVCPITGEPLGSMGMPYKITVKGRPVFLCCQGCELVVEDDPDAVLKKLDEMMSEHTHTEQ